MNELWRFVTTASNWQGHSGIWSRTCTHLEVCIVSLLIAVSIAVPGGIVAFRSRIAALVGQTAASVVRAIPSFALLALIFPLSIRWGFGLGFWPTVVPLVALALPPIFLSTLTGLRTVDSSALHAAHAMGMSERQTFRYVQVPLSAPFVVTGLRIATVQVIATATLGAFVALNGLGSFIEEGRLEPNTAKLLTGSLIVSSLALGGFGALSLCERAVSRWREIES